MCRATVAYVGEGYDAMMAWVQVVRYEAGGGETALVDKAPQLAEADLPYYAYGIRPEFFDAPSMPRAGEVRWNAHAFLVASPDAVMSRTVEPVCGFRWGYRVKGESPGLLPLARAGMADWSAARDVLRERYPSWTFGAAWSPGSCPMPDPPPDRSSPVV